MSPAPNGIGSATSHGDMKLHIISDLHLSVHPFAPPRTDADVVVLAGDVARPPEAIAWARGFEKPVVLVPGNHEFLDKEKDVERRGRARP